MQELRQIGKECGLPRSSVHEAVEKLVMSPFMTGTVGGSRLANE
jgi:hypothetical protein